VDLEPNTAYVLEDECSGCKSCLPLCSYSAISYNEEKKKAEINEVLCKGWGLHGVVPVGSIEQHLFRTEIFAEIEGAGPCLKRSKPTALNRRLAFFCNWCTYRQTWQASRLKYPANTRVIGECSGASMQFVLEAFAQRRRRADWWLSSRRLPLQEEQLQSAAAPPAETRRARHGHRGEALSLVDLRLRRRAPRRRHRHGGKSARLGPLKMTVPRKNRGGWRPDGDKPSRIYWWRPAAAAVKPSWIWPKSWTWWHGGYRLLAGARLAQDVERSDGAILATFLNGAIRTSEQAEMAQLLRRKSKLMVAFGACSHLGGIPGLANACDRSGIMQTAYLDSPSTVNPEGVIPKPVHRDNGHTVTLPHFFETVRSLDQVVEWTSSRVRAHAKIIMGRSRHC
jgi:coenzyme F420-reducing hydrogenase gamma subunit